MIRVRKPPDPPGVLRTRGRRAARDLRKAYDASPDEYDSGKKTFDFDRSIYAAESVKDALKKAQHGKCAFCESKFGHVAYGDVEHLRPKAGYAQEEGDPPGRPGYYWLAYEWANLFLSCQLCNQRFKRNLFPLRRPGRRALCHRDDIRQEEPLLIDPGGADPGRSLGFREEIAYPVRGSREGRETIEVLGLNRDELVEMRRERLAVLKMLRDTRLLWQRRQAAGGVFSAREKKLLADVEAKLQDLTQDPAEYAAMARAALK